MTKLQALGAGLVGACTLTLLHESARRLTPHAPRMDVMGMRAIAKSLSKIGMTPPSDDRLHRLALIGDLVSNSFYYSLIGVGDDDHVWRRGALLGLSAGISAVTLPRPLDLGRQPGERAPMTQIMTMAWYLAGGLAAAAASRCFSSASD